MKYETKKNGEIEASIERTIVALGDAISKSHDGKVTHWDGSRVDVEEVPYTFGLGFSCKGEAEEWIKKLGERYKGTRRLSVVPMLRGEHLASGEYIYNPADYKG